MKAILIFVLGSLISFAAAAQTTDTVKRVPIKNTEFNKLINTVRSHGSEPVNEEAIRAAFTSSNTYYTTAQIHKLLTMVAKDSEKLAMARAAYSRVTDPQKYVQLADLFRSESYRIAFNHWCERRDKDQEDSENKPVTD